VPVPSPDIWSLIQSQVAQVIHKIIDNNQSLLNCSTSSTNTAKEKEEGTSHCSISKHHIHLMRSRKNSKRSTGRITRS
jgi:hypothetical protein